MSFINAIGVAVPQHQYEQSQLALFMKKFANNEQEAQFVQTVFRASGIKTRHSVLADYGRETDFTFYPDNKNFEPFPTTAQRMQAYRQHAVTLGADAVVQAVGSGFNYKKITHLITVSCTGMYAPGLDIDLIAKLGCNITVNRTAINFMGCYAAITALKMAEAIVQASKDQQVLIVCVELCSLHFQKKISNDNVLANALFADGAAAVLVTNEATAPQALSVEGFHTELFSNGANDMAWTIGDFGFEMRLSAYVPDILKVGMGDYVKSFCSRLNLAPETINHYVIHPGGKRILDSACEVLTLPKAKLEHAYAVLREFGNMSSPTVLFVLKWMLDNNAIKSSQEILAMAFGPGLTIEGMMLKAV